MQIIPHGITLTMDQDGRASGDAYVEFASSQDVDEALKKHKDKMGHRWGWLNTQLKKETTQGTFSGYS